MYMECKDILQNTMLGRRSSFPVEVLHPRRNRGKCLFTCSSNRRTGPKFRDRFPSLVYEALLP